MRKTVIFTLLFAIISASLSVSSASASGSNVSGSGSMDSEWFELTSLGIFQGYATNDYGENDQLTRAQFCAIMTRFMCLEDAGSALSYSGGFDDVNAEDWYAGYVELMYQMGVMVGYPDGTFRPENYVEKAEAVKTVLIALGYHAVAEQNGGYPDGYNMFARQSGLLKNVNDGDLFTRGDAAQIIYNALHINVLKKYSSDYYAIAEGETYYNMHMATKDMYYDKGVVQANAYSYIDVPIEDLQDDEIVIDNVVYKIGATTVSDYLGMEVEIYSHKNESDEYIVTSVRLTSDNDVNTVDRYDVHSIDKGSITYYEGDRTKKAAIDSDASVLWNGTPVEFEEWTIEDFKQGYVTCISNDRDSSIDVLLIESYENVVVDMVNEYTITFKEGTSFDGYRYFSEKDDDEIKYVYYDKEGNEIGFGDIKAEDTVSIFADKKGRRYRLIVSPDTVEGKITAFDSEHLYIDDQKYLKAEGGTLSESEIGDVIIANLDFSGKIAYFERGEQQLGFAYVLGVAKTGFDDVNVKLLLGSNPKLSADVDDSDQDNVTTTPLLLCQNTGTEVYALSSSCRINGQKCDATEVLNILQSNPVISFDLAADNTIKDIETLSMYAGDLSTKLRYNVYDKTFGGYEYIDGLQIDEQTIVICLPENVNDNDDYMVTTRIDVAGNSVGYLVQGYEYDVNTKKAGLAVITTGMDSSLVRNPSISSSKACMVLSKSIVLDENGDEIYRIKLLEDGEEKEYYTVDITSDNQVIDAIKTGDLITYIKNASDQIENVMLLHSFDSENTDIYAYNSTGGYLEVLGDITEIDFNELYNSGNYLTNDITITFADDESTVMPVRVRNTPPVYLFENGKNPTIRKAVLEEAAVGQDKCYVLAVGGTEAKVCVIIRGES